MPPYIHTDSTDYVFDTLTVTISPTSSSPVCVSFNATQDMAVEGEHGFTVSIDGGMPSDVVQIGTPSSQDVTITDDDGMRYSSACVESIVCSCFNSHMSLSLQSPKLLSLLLPVLIQLMRVIVFQCVWTSASLLATVWAVTSLWT